MKTVIVDGFWGWHSRWEKLRRRVEKATGSCVIWQYDSSGRKSLEQLGEEFRSAAQTFEEPFAAVGYSMGGLVIREAMRQAPGLSLRRAVFLHTPHVGSLAAHLLSLPACREMRPRSAFLQRLAEAPWDIPTLATWCPCDLTVLPGSSARWTRATSILRSDIPAHDWPIFSSGIHGRIVEFLTA